MTLILKGSKVAKKSINLKSLAKDWLKYLNTERGLFNKSITEKTLESYGHRINLLIKYLEREKVNISILTKDDAKKLIAIIKDKEGYSDNTLRLTLSSASSFWQNKKKKGLIKKGRENPFKVSIPRKKNQNLSNLDEKILSDDDIKLILNNKVFKHESVSEETRKAILLMLCFGLRVSELEKLKKDDIMFNGTIEIKIRESKGSAIRQTYLNPYYQDYFNEIKGIIDDDLKFKAVTLKDRIKRISKVIGVKFSAHSFRHTFATRYLEKGGTIEALKSMLGHSSITTTEIYGKVTDKKVKDEIKGLL